MTRRASDPVGLPILRMITGVGRSGTTALLRAFANHPRIFALYQPIKAGHRATGEEDYRIYADHPLFDAHPGKAFVVKEVTGYAFGRTQLVIFPSDDELRRVRPVFLMRDPIPTWQSWKKLLGHVVPNALERYVSAFLSASALYDHSQEIEPGVALALTHETLVAQPEPALRTICEHWGLDFVPAMLSWDHPLEHQLYIDEGTRAFSNQDERWHGSVSRSTTIQASAPEPVEVSDAERRTIEATLRPAYRRFERAAYADFP